MKNIIHSFGLLAAISLLGCSMQTVKPKEKFAVYGSKGANDIIHIIGSYTKNQGYKINYGTLPKNGRLISQLLVTSKSCTLLTASDFNHEDVVDVYIFECDSKDFHEFSRLLKHYLENEYKLSIEK